MTLDPLVVARALGGDVCGDEVLCPGPGHSNADRSLSVKPKRDAADGFLVYSFAGDDPILCRDHVRTKLGLPEPQQKTGGGKWNELGDWDFGPGWNRVLVSRWTTAGAFAVADAVRLTPCP